MSQYVTSPGDTLASIAQKLGDPSRWSAIYEANKDGILGLLAQGLVFPHNTELEIPDESGQLDDLHGAAA